MNKPIHNSTFGKFAKDRHKRTAKAVAYAQTHADHPAMVQLRGIFRARLTPVENAALAWSALGALDPEHAHLAATTVLDCMRCGMPLEPENDAIDEAAFWSARAADDELRAYALACYNRLHPSDQTEFRSYLNRRDSA